MSNARYTVTEENCWNYAEDATSRWSTIYPTVEAAIAAVEERVAEIRAEWAAEPDTFNETPVWEGFEQGRQMEYTQVEYFAKLYRSEEDDEDGSPHWRYTIGTVYLQGGDSA